MKRFLQFDSVYGMISQMNSMLPIETDDRLCYTFNHKKGSASLSVESKRKSTFFPKAKVQANMHPFTANVAADGSYSVFASLSGDLQANTHITCFLKSTKAPGDPADIRFMPSCVFAVNGVHTMPNLTSFLGVGIKKDRSICSLIGASTPIFDASLRVILNDRGNLIKGSVITPYWLFSSFKIDISMRQIHGFEIGAIYKGRCTSLFGSWDIYKRRMSGGVFANVTQNVKIAAKGAFNLSTKDIEGEIGASIQNSSRLKARLVSNNSVELSASFNPRDWVDVSFRSIASPTGKHSVKYGWSLDFHTTM